MLGLVLLVFIAAEGTFREHRKELEVQRRKYIAQAQRQRTRAQLNEIKAGVQNVKELVATRGAPEPARSQRQEPEALEAIPANPKPVLECVHVETIKVRKDGFNRITKDEGSLNKATLAYFHLKPLPDSEPWIRVRAIITLHDLDNNRKERGKDGVWYLKTDKEITFNIGDTHPLVVAIFGTQVGTYEHALKQGGRPFFKRYLSPEIDVLEGKKFHVSVQLIGQASGELVVDETFEFSLVTEPEFKLEEIKADQQTQAGENRAKRAYIIERLKELIRRDSEIGGGGWVGIDSPGFMKAMSLHGHVKRFLTDYFDESYVKRYEEQGIAVLEQILREFLS
jgi:hypothetical protein